MSAIVEHVSDMLGKCDDGEELTHQAWLASASAEDIAQEIATQFKQ